MKDFTLRNDLAEIESVTLAILDFCRDRGVSENACYDIRLALEEAISNTIKYGYDDQSVHSISIRAGLESNNELLLEIEDDARAFNPIEAPAPDVSLPVEEKQIGGLGIYLLRAVMDRVQYERHGDKNILRMWKSL